MLNILRSLNNEDLLNAVGVAIVENPVMFTRTLESMEYCFEGYEEAEIEERIATSSLVGHDWKLAIEEWIALEEVGSMRKLLEI